jgi:hypothetical protein
MDQIDKVNKLTKVSESEQMTYLRHENSRLRNENNALRNNKGFLKEMIKELGDALQASEPLPPIDFKYPGKKAESEIVAVLKLSDWHIGANIRPEETEGFGQFNWEIAQERVQYLAVKFLEWIETHRRSFRIHKLVILGEADWVSGDIHEELRTTNEFPLPIQSIRAGQLLAQLVSTLAPHFPEILFSQVGADNHGRLQPKPQFKQKSLNSMSFIVYAVANEILRKHKHIEIKFSEGIKQVVDINGKKFLTEHGDIIKAWAGIPFYGMERYRGKEAVKRLQTDLGFDYLSIGHFHVPGIISGNILTNGSLTGTDEFDHGCGRYSPPTQVSFLVHPRYGIFNFTSWQFKR